MNYKNFIKPERAERHGGTLRAVAKRGLILTEVILSLALLSVSVVILYSLINNAIKTSIFSRSFLIAENLSTEAIEAVTNIRNTNWMHHPDDPACWLVFEPDPSAFDCSLADPAGFFLVERDVTTDDFWKLVNKSDKLLDLTLEDDQATEVNNNLFRMRMQDLDDDGNPDFYLQTDDPKYEFSPFYRSLQFSSITQDMAEFLVRVQWKDGAKVRTLDHEVVIYNHL